MAYRVLFNLYIKRENQPTSKFHALGETQTEPKNEAEYSIATKDTNSGCMIFTCDDAFENLTERWVSIDAYTDANNCDEELTLSTLTDLAKQGFVSAGFIIVDYNGKPLK